MRYTITESKLRGMIQEAVRQALNEVSALTAWNTEAGFSQEINAMYQALKTGQQTGQYKWTKRYYQQKQRNPRLTPQMYMQNLNRGLETARNSYTKDELIVDMAKALNIVPSLFQQIINDKEVHDEGYRMGINPQKCAKYKGSDPQIVQKINNIGNISWGGATKGFLGMGKKGDRWGVHKNGVHKNGGVKMANKTSAINYNGTNFSDFAGLQ